MAEAELNLLTGATDGWQKTLAQGMLELPLPPDWKKKQGYKGRPYYFHRLTGDTSSSHPQLTLFKSIMEEVTSWPPDGAPQELARLWARTTGSHGFITLRRSERHLRTAHVAALKVLSQWSGPHCMEGGSRPDRPLPVDVRDVYFYNCSTRETSWVDPRGPLQFDLQQRQELLNTAMALFPLRGSWAEVIAFTGCASEQTSADVGDVQQQFHLQAVEGGHLLLDNTARAGGALTSAFIEAMQSLLEGSTMTYVELLEHLRQRLANEGFSQVPQLASSLILDLQEPFSLDTVLVQSSSSHARARHAAVGPKRSVDAPASYPMDTQGGFATALMGAANAFFTAEAVEEGIDLLDEAGDMLFENAEEQDDF
eukprot:g11165.t1